MPLGLGSSLTEERLETEKTLFLAEWAKGGGRGRFWPPPELLWLELEEVVTAAEEIRLESSGFPVPKPPQILSLS